MSETRAKYGSGYLFLWSTFVGLLLMGQPSNVLASQVGEAQVDSPTDCVDSPSMRKVIPPRPLGGTLTSLG